MVAYGIDLLYADILIVVMDIDTSVLTPGGRYPTGTVSLTKVTRGVLS